MEAPLRPSASVFVFLIYNWLNEEGARELLANSTLINAVAVPEKRWRDGELPIKS